MNVFENGVGQVVAVTAFPPSLNNALVISIYLEIYVGGSSVKDCESMAQPISHPSVCQFGCRYHTLHCLLSMMPILVEELASEKVMRLMMGWGCGMGVGMGGALSLLRHHLRSSWVPHGGVLGLNGSLPKMPSIDSRLVR